MLKKARREGEKKMAKKQQKKREIEEMEESEEEGSEINMEDYDVEEISNPDNEEYQGESEDEYGDEEGEDEMEEGEFEMEEDEDEDEEGFGESDSERYDRPDGISMTVTDLERLYEIKNGKVVKREGVVNEFENVVPKKKDKKQADKKEEKTPNNKKERPQVTADLLEVKTVEKKNKRKSEQELDGGAVKKQRVTFNNLQ